MTSKKKILVELYNQVNISDALWIPKEGDIFSTSYTYPSAVVDYSYGISGWGILPYGESGTATIEQPREPLIKVGSVMIGEDFYYASSTYEDLYNNEYTYLWDNQILFVHTPGGLNPRTYGYVSIGVAKGYTNNPGWYDDIYYDGRIKSIPSIIRSIDNLYYGVVSFEGGDIELINTDGYFDTIKQLGIYGQKVKIFFGEDDVEPVQIYEGVVQSVNIGEEVATISTIDPRKLLNKELPAQNWTLEDYPNIEEDLLDEYIPLTYGRIHASVVCTDSALDGLTSYHFKITNRKIKSIDAVYVDGEEVAFDGVDLDAATFILSSSVYENSQDVTADFQGYVDENGDLIENPVDIIKDLLIQNTSAFYSDLVFDMEEWDAVRNSNLPPCHLYVDDPKTIIDLINDLCVSCFLSFLVLGDGRYTLKKRDLLKNSVRSLYFSDLISREESEEETDEYVSSCEIGFNKDYDENEFSWHIDRTLEKSLYAKYVSYNHKPFETRLITEEDAESYGKEILSYFGGHYETIPIIVKTNHFDLELEDIITVNAKLRVNAPDYWIRAEIISKEFDLSNFEIRFELRFIEITDPPKEDTVWNNPLYKGASFTAADIILEYSDQPGLIVESGKDPVTIYERI